MEVIKKIFISLLLIMCLAGFKFSEKFGMQPVMSVQSDGLEILLYADDMQFIESANMDIYIKKIAEIIKDTHVGEEKIGE